MELKAGYKSTELGVLPIDWKVQTIESVMSEISMGPFGSDIKVSNFVAFGVPVLSGLNVRSERLLDSFTNFVTPEKAKDLKKAVARRGDVVITHRGTLGQISYIPVDSEFDRYVISQSQFRVRFNLSAVLPNWIALYFLSPLGSAKLLEGKGHTGVPALAQATTKFRQLHIPLPSLDEQRAIATALSDVDALIAGLEKLIAKKRDLKQAAMQQLLTGQTRLPGFSGEWTVKRFSEVAALKNGYIFRSETYLSTGNYKVITIANVQDGYMAAEFCNVVGAPPKDIQPHQELKIGDILISMTGNVGRVCRVSEDNCLLNQRVGKLVPMAIDGDFLFAVLCSPSFTESMIGTAKGGAQPNLSAMDINEYEFRMPMNIAEQSAIATVITDINAELSALEFRQAKTREIKQGMMQDLLTGRTRLL
jgi:type I restriction enzyme, S subunit